jgi:nitrous oxide reductase accessory protein NosL
MAYYAPFYRPTYYDQMNTPSFNQQPMVQPVQQIPTPAQQTNNGLVWVQGEAGAKSFLVAPGCTVMLMDSEGERFYLKSADASGMPLPLRVFEYKERTETAQQTAGGSVAAFDDLDNKFVTRDEFERRMASIAPQKKSKNKLTEDAEDGDTTI